MNEKKKHRPNIILIVIDALRARSLSCYGSERLKSSNIDRLAEKGILFEDVYSAWNTTDQSLTTILTGRYPRTHGIVRQGYRIKPEDLETFEKLEVKLLAEILHEHGYKTFAIDWMSRWFEKGFDYYGYKPEGNVLQRIYYHLVKLPFLHLRYIFRSLGILKIYTKKREFSLKKTWESFKDVFKTFLFTFELARIQDTGFIRGLAEDLLKKAKKESFFLFLHVWDTHHPYFCPKRFVPEDKKHSGIKELLLKKYLGSVKYVDDQLGKFFKYLKEKKLLDDTFIIVTSDHGESLTEHGIYFDHHGLYDETTHCPLIFHYPKFFSESKRIKGFVQHVDILPTLCELLGIDSSEYQFDGKNLIPMINGEVDEIRPFVFTEESYAQRKIALRDEEFKYIYAPDNEGMCNYCQKVHGGPEELYDLEKDPREKKNIAHKNREKTRAMKERLLKVLKRLNTKREKQRIAKEIVLWGEEEMFSAVSLQGESSGSKKNEGKKGGPMPERKITIEVPEELAQRIEKRIKNSEFESVEQYLSFFLQKLLQETRKETKLTKKEDKKIKKQLKSLGYMD